MSSSGSKKEAPPPRPPAPRVSLSKLRGSVGGSGAAGNAVTSVSIHFSPGSVDEEEDIVSLNEESVVIATRPVVSSVKKQQTPEKLKTLKPSGLNWRDKEPDDSPSKAVSTATSKAGSTQASSTDLDTKIVVGNVGKITASKRTVVVGHVSTSNRQSDSSTISKSNVGDASSRGFMKPQKAEIAESNITAEMEKKTSLLADIKGKLSDKFVDPLTAALREKIEELSSDSSPEEDRPQKSRDVFSKRLFSSLDEQQVNNPEDTKKVVNMVKQGSLDGIRLDGFMDQHFGESKLSSTGKVNSKSEGPVSQQNSEGDSNIDYAIPESDYAFDNVDIAVEPFESFNGAVNDTANVQGRKNESSSSLMKTESTSTKSSPVSKGDSQKHKPAPLLVYPNAKSGSNLGQQQPSLPGNAVPVVSLSSLLSQKEDEDDLVFTPESDTNEKFFSPTEVSTAAQARNKEDDFEEPSKQKPYEDVKPPDTLSKPVPVQRFALLAMLLFVYLILPLPSYLSGFIMGAVLASLGWVSWMWLTAPPPYRPPAVIPELSSLPPLQVPEMKESKNEDGKFKGWVNELDSYDPDNYHINKTHSIYVQLEGTILRLQRPRQNVPKRAMWDDPHPNNVQFIHQRHYDLTGSRVYLQPDGLVKKRVWSKKYPICINLAKTQIFSPRKASTGGSTSEEQDSSAKKLGFEIVAKDACQKSTLYIFARTGREKEEWYRRFHTAANGNPLPCRFSNLTKPEPRVRHSSSSEFSLRHRRQGSTESIGSTHSEPSRDQPDVPKDSQNLLSEYLRYMGRIMPADNIAKPNNSPFRTLNSISCESHVVWTNAVIGRLFWDFFQSKHWEERVSEKIQKKLSKIHVPYFIDELTVTGIDLGSEMPTIRRISRPYLDERGMWIDLDLAYSGGFNMSLETKVNLMKLKKTKAVSRGSQEKRSPVTDSDEEDSAESSTDEEAEEKFDDNTNDEAGGSSGKGKKIWRIVDKITKSKYFQQATEYKYIKKAMEEVSNTPLVLTVAVQSLVGTLAVNIPPPPSDRIWYGFRTNPRLWLSAKPKVGEREVTVTHVTDWIEKKLAIEFQRIVVMPNMDDLPIPLMLTQVNDTAPSPAT